MHGVRSQTLTLGVYADSGRFPLYLRQQLLVIKYWIHILQSPVNGPLVSAYNTLYNLCNAGQTNWCSVVKNILEVNNLQSYWEAQHVEQH